MKKTLLTLLFMSIAAVTFAGPNYFEYTGGLTIDYGTDGLWEYDGSLPLAKQTWADVLDPVAFGDKVACTYLDDLYSFDPADSPAPWTMIASAPNEGYIAYDQGGGIGLAVDFGTDGLWFFDGSLPLVQMTWADVSDMVAFSNSIAVMYNDQLYGFNPNDSPPWTLVSDNEVYPGQALVAKTGQTTSYRTGDDGDEEPGVGSPNPRFIDNLNGTITDSLTGLIWLKQANYNDISETTGTATWNNAVDFCEALANGSCGLTDGSSAGDWRLPSVKELHSLIDYENYGPALPTGHPFVNVQSQYYWSGTTYSDDTSYAWGVHVGGGSVDGGNANNYVWPVRSAD